MELKQVLAMNIKKCMDEQGINVTNFAKLIKNSNDTKTVRSWLSGEGNPTIKTIGKIAKVLNVSELDLVRYDENKPLTLPKLEPHQQIVLEYLESQGDAYLFDVIHNLENGYQEDWIEIPEKVKEAYGNLDVEEEREVLRRLVL